MHVWLPCVVKRAVHERMQCTALHLSIISVIMIHVNCARRPSRYEVQWQYQYVPHAYVPKHHWERTILKCVLRNRFNNICSRYTVRNKKTGCDVFNHVSPSHANQLLLESQYTLGNTAACSIILYSNASVCDDLFVPYCITSSAISRLLTPTCVPTCCVALHHILLIVSNVLHNAHNSYLPLKKILLVRVNP